MLNLSSSYLTLAEVYIQFNAECPTLSDECRSRDSYWKLNFPSRNILPALLSKKTT